MKKSRFYKAIAILLAVLTVGISIRFILIRPQQVLADSLFKFDEGYGTSNAVNDANGTVSAGSITNAVWKAEEFCKDGKCLYFDGTGDYVSFADDQDLDFSATNAFTVMGWFRHPEIATNPDYLVAKHQSTVAGGYKVYMDSDGDMVFGIDDDGTWGPEDSVGGNAGKNFDDNKWHFFTAVKDGTTGIYLYVDGVLIDSDTSLTASGSLANAASFYIGIDADGSSNAWSGFIDEVRVLRTAKTQAQIAADYLAATSNTTSGAAPLLHWKFDENTGTTTTYDSSGNGRDGTMTGLASDDWVTGKSGYALDFDNANDNVSIADNDVFSVNTTNQLTVEAWFNPTNLSLTQEVVNKGSGSNYEWALRVNGDGTFLAYLYQSGGGDYMVTQNYSLSTNKWHHLAMVADLSQPSLKAYVNGVLVAEDTTASGSYTNGTAAVRVGERADGLRDVDGIVDDVRIYNYARSQNQIQEDMNTNPPTGTSASLGPNQSFLSNGLVGYWKLDESATPAVDSSGNGNNGTWTNTPTSILGKYGNGVYFDTATTNKYISVPAASSINNLSQFTLSAWVNPSQLQDGTRILTKANKYGLYFENVSSGLRTQFEIACSGGYTNIFATSTDNLTLNTWSHIAATWDGAGCGLENVTVYINGKPIAKHANSSASSGTRDDDSGGPFTIANQYSSYSTQLQGSVDEARVYNRALSPAEIQQLYNWAPGPLGLWKLDERSGTSAFDSSGNGLTGAFQDSSTAADWTTGVFGSAVSFIGTNKSILVSNSTAFDFGTSKQFTLGTWVKMTNVASSQTILTHTGSVAGGVEIYSGSDGGIRAAIGSGTYCSIRDSTNIEDNRWHHIEIVFNRGSGCTNANTYIYIDGVRKTGVVADSSGNANANIDIGGLKFTATTADDGVILDNVVAYNYARSHTQVVEDMNAGHPAPGSPIGSAVAHWKFDEGTGTTANDESINSNSLTLSTASWTNSGKYGKAFNGLTNVRASRTTDADLEFSAVDDFTISLWYKSDSANNPGATEYLVNDGAAAGSAGYAIYANTSGNLCFGIDDDTTWGPDVASCTTTDVYDSTWHHVVAIRSVILDKTFIYIDGVETDSDTDTTTATLDSSPTFYIGDANATDGNDEFLGDIDEVKIFRSAFAPDQVKLLYNQSAGIAMGALSTDSSNNPSWSAENEYCPPGQGSTCTPPILHYQMDENTGTTSTNDISTNGYTGTLNGSMTGDDWTPGKYGSALDFDGTDDSVQNTSISLPTGDFTYSIWIYPTAFATSNAFIGLAQASIGGNEFMIDTDTDGDVDVILDNGTLLINGTNGLVTTNTWTHVAVTRIGSTVTSYVNGKIDVVATDGDALSLAACGIRIGRSQSSTTCSSAGTSIFQGKLDDLRVYNYGRTQAQVLWDMNQGQPIGWYRFDEGAGTSANDATGFGNTFTLSASSWSTGKRNDAWNGDGAKWVSRADDADFDFLATEDFAISLWFKSDSTTNPSANEYLLNKSLSGGTQNAGYGIYSKSDSSGQICFGIDDDTTWNPDVETCTTNDLYDTTWHHIVAYRNVTNDAIYIVVDGTADTSAADSTTATLANSRTMYFGDRNGSDDGTELNGDLDDIRIYRYSPSSQQIKSIISEGALRFGPANGAP